MWREHWLYDWARGWLRFLAALGVLALLLGVPHVRVAAQGDERVPGHVNFTSCTYLGPFGLWRAKPGRDVFEDCPGFVWRSVPEML